MIYGEIKRFLRDDGLIKISREVKRNAQHIRRFEESYEQENGSSPTITEISEALDISPEDVVVAMSASLPVSPLTIESEDGTTFDIPVGIDETDKTVEKFALVQAIDALPENDKKLIILRFYKNLTQQQTANLLGVSQVKVSRMEKRICIKLKSLLQ